MQLSVIFGILKEERERKNILALFEQIPLCENALAFLEQILLCERVLKLEKLAGLSISRASSVSKKYLILS